MTKKVISIITCFFLIRLLSSCCDCGEQPEYSISYTSITTQLTNTAGYEDVVVMDSVSRKSFGLIITPEFETLETSSLINIFSEFGFNSALACSCPGELYYVSDLIDEIKIFVIDTNIKSDVTESFNKLDSFELVSPYESKEFPRPEDFLIKYELTKYESIPDSSTFLIEITLESGEVLNQQTETINFYD